MVIRTLIADDHGVVREGLRFLLGAEPSVSVVGVVASAEEAVEQVGELAPDLVFMDISIPEAGGIQATRRIKQLAPATCVLILTVHEDKALMREAMQAGASGYLLKQAGRAELMDAIRSVMHGEIYIHPAMARLLMKDFLEEPPPKVEISEDAPELTPREIEVLRLLAQGYTNRQVADQLGISIRTAEFHRANVSNKVQATGRVGLVRYAEEHGLI